MLLCLDRRSRRISSNYIRLQLEALEARDCPSVTTWTGEGSDDYWSTAANWSNGVAGVNNDPVINDAGATIILDGNVEVANLTLSAGTLTGSYTLTITGSDSLWSGGTITGEGTTLIAEGATFTISAATEHFLQAGHTIQNQGAVIWTGAGAILTSSGTTSFVNEGALDIQGNGFMGGWGGTLTFTNVEGATVTKSAGSGTTIFLADFANAGTVAVEVGTIKFSGGGTSTSVLTAAADATLEFACNYALTDTSTVSGAGTLQVSGGTVTAAGSYEIANTHITAGTLDFTTDVTVAHVLLGAGTLSSDSLFTVTDSFEWTAGTITGAGTTLIDAGATLTIGGAYELFLQGGHTIQNQGEVVWTDNSWIMTTSGTSTFVNEADVDIQGNGFIGGWGGTLIVTNTGTLTKSGGSGTTTFLTEFENNGIAESQVGTLALGTGVNHGVFVIHPDAYLTFENDTSRPPDQINAPGDEVELHDYWWLLIGDLGNFDATGLPDGLSIDANTATISGTIALDAGDTEYYGVTISATHSSPDVTVIMNLVWRVDVPPVASDATFTVLHGTEFNPGDWSQFASDADGDALQMLIVEQPLHGDVCPNTYGSFVYLPELGFTGTVTFTFKMTDGIAESNVATITLNVVNQAPVATNDSYVVPMNGSIILTNLHLNGTDADGDALYAALEQSTNAQVTDLGDGRYQYTPNVNFVGYDYVNFKLMDGQAFSNSATISFQVIDSPILANNVRLETPQDFALTISPQDLLKTAFSVLGSAALQVIALTPPATGDFTANNDGTWTYKPVLGFVGQVVLPFILSDLANTANATLTLFVQPPNIQMFEQPIAALSGVLEMLIRRFNTNPANLDDVRPFTLPQINQLLQNNSDLHVTNQAALFLLRSMVYQNGEDARYLGVFANSFDVVNRNSTISLAQIQAFGRRTTQDPADPAFQVMGQGVRDRIRDARQMDTIYGQLVTQFNLMTRGTRLFPDQGTLTNAEFATQLAASVKQSQLYGDCSFLSAFINAVRLNGIAWLRNNIIEIKTNGVVTGYSVRGLYDANSNINPVTFQYAQAPWETFDFPIAALRLQHAYATDGTLWVTVYEIGYLRARLRQEAAVAAAWRQPLRYVWNGNYLQPVTGGEFGRAAIRRITGSSISGSVTPQLYNPMDVVLMLQGAATTLMVTSTWPTFLAPAVQTAAANTGIYANHAYAVVGYSAQLGVRLRNPHNQPGLPGDSGRQFDISLENYLLLFWYLSGDQLAQGRLLSPG